MAERLRAAMLLDALAAPARRGPGAEAPGIVIIDGARVRAASASAEEWLDELAPDRGARSGARLHAALLAVAAAAGSVGEDGTPTPPARAVLRTPAGRRLGLHGLRLEAGGGEPQIAVIMEAARPPELAAVVMSAYGLSAREREVAQQVISGASTDEAATALHISPYTLQDHLKSIFDKVGVRSRGQLTKEIFDRHYAAAPPAGPGGSGDRTTARRPP